MNKTTLKLAPFWLAVGLSLLLAVLNLVGVISLSWWLILLPVLLYFGVAFLVVVVVALLVAYTVVAAMVYDSLPPRY